MEILVIVIFIAIVMLPLLFLAGIILMAYGKLKQRRKAFGLGSIFFVGSIVAVSALFVHQYGLGKIAPKLTSEDLVGHYKLADADSKIQLYLNDGGKFEALGEIGNCLCPKGRYHAYDNEIWFTCESSSLTAKIHRGFFGVELRFMSTGKSHETLYTLKKTD